MMGASHPVLAIASIGAIIRASDPMLLAAGAAASLLPDIDSSKIISWSDVSLVPWSRQGTHI